MILSLIAQEASGGFDYMWLLLPLLCCALTMGGQRGGKSSQESVPESDAFYTAQNIQESYERIGVEIEQWRLAAQEKKPEGLVSNVVRRLRGEGKQERFVEKERSPPRLISLTDVSGPIFFELTEVEGGGTVIKATYSSDLKARFAKLKAALPLKIPVSPIAFNCPTCSKSVLKDFNLCPYCGSKLIKE
jgi:hypothetical protein